MKNRFLKVFTVIFVTSLIASSIVILFLDKQQLDSNSFFSENENIDICHAYMGDVENAFTAVGEVRLINSNTVLLPVDCVIKEIVVEKGMFYLANTELFSIDKQSLIDSLETSKKELTEVIKSLSNVYPKKQDINIRAENYGTIVENNAGYKLTVEDIMLSEDAIIVIENENGLHAIGEYLPNGVIVSVKSRSDIGREVKAGDILFVISVYDDEFYEKVEYCEAIREKIRKIQNLIDNPLICTEVPCIVDEVYAGDGAKIMSDMPILSLFTLDEYEIAVDISHETLKALSIGQVVEITLESGVMRSGIITFISYIANKEGQYRMNVTFGNDVDNTNLDILPGMLGKIEVLLERSENTVLVPTEAIKVDRLGEYVMVYTGENEANYESEANASQYEQRYIERGITNGLVAEIISGLASDEQVLIFKTSNEIS